MTSAEKQAAMEMGCVLNALKAEFVAFRENRRSPTELARALGRAEAKLRTDEGSGLLDCFGGPDFAFHVAGLGLVITGISPADLEAARAGEHPVMRENLKENHGPLESIVRLDVALTRLLGEVEAALGLASPASSPGRG